MILYYFGLLFHYDFEITDSSLYVLFNSLLDMHFAR